MSGAPTPTCRSARRILDACIQISSSAWLDFGGLPLLHVSDLCPSGCPGRAEWVPAEPTDRDRTSAVGRSACGLLNSSRGEDRCFFSVAHPMFGVTPRNPLRYKGRIFN